jgi:predicted alpha/beta hydrolase family esterase
MTEPTVVLVPGLRGHDEDHWQTRLAATLPRAWHMPPLGRTEPSLRVRVALLDRMVDDVDGPVVLVAHSAGCLVTVHWAQQHTGAKVVGALLATPPTLAAQLPPGYPSVLELRREGWLPIPRRPLPFPSIVATSEDDPLADPVRLRAMARAWGSRVHSLGAAGHLNPASGFGDRPGVLPLVDELLAAARRPARATA